MAALLDGCGLPAELNAHILQHLGPRLDMRQLVALCGISRSAREAVARSPLAISFSRRILGAGYGRWTSVLQLVAQRCPSVFQLEFSSSDIDRVAVSYLRSGAFPALNSLRLIRCYHLRAPYDIHPNSAKLVAMASDANLAPLATPDRIDSETPLDSSEQQEPQEAQRTQEPQECTDPPVSRGVQLRELVALNLNILDHAGFSLKNVRTLVMTGCESSMDGAQFDGLLNLLERQAPQLRHLFLGGAKLQLYSAGRELSVPQVELCEMTFWDDECKTMASSFLPNAKIVDLTDLKTFKAADATSGHDRTLPWDCAVECRGRRGVRPLHLAAIRGDAEAVSWLLSVGAEVNAKDAKGCTALFRACQHGSTKAAQYLLDAGADYLLQNQSLETPLYIASLCGFCGCVEALLTADSDSARFQLARFDYFDGWSPLHAACLKGSLEIVQTLLDAGFDANAVNKWRQSPMHVVARSGNVELAELLYTRRAVASIDTDISTHTSCPSCVAHESAVFETDGANSCAPKNGEGAKTLAASSQLEIDQTDVDELTPAQIAQNRGHIKMVMWLAERGAMIPKANEKSKRRGSRRQKKKQGASAQGRRVESQPEAAQMQARTLAAGEAGDRRVHGEATAAVDASRIPQ